VTPRRPRVAVVGSANMDLVVDAPTLPRPGETVLGGTFRTAPGGKGANQAVAATRAGARCDLVGAVGDDAFGAALRESLHTAGVGLDRLRTVPGPSGVALIAVDAKAENLIVVAPGANGELAGLDDGDRAAIAAADVLLCQLEVPLPTVAEAAAAARAAGTAVVLNAAPARALDADVLAGVDLLVVNEGEAAAIAAGDAGAPPDRLAEALLARVPRVVLTLGARGAAYADRDGLRLAVRAPRVAAVDTTGAGDAFAGALAVAWAGGGPTARSLEWACAAGAACARRPGASTALPTRAEIDELHAATYGAAA
jgi:ribokinase